MARWGKRPQALVALLILSGVSFLNYFDRYLITIVLEPIKQELALTDMQVGLLTGLAFVIIYTVAGIPIGRYADRYGRVRVLGMALAFWSVMTSACGFATGFVSLFLTRMGVGLGEAAGLPTVHALAAEYFPRHRRGLALTVIAVASSLGTQLGLLIGGLVSDAWGWRTAFIIAGIPGILLAGVILLTLQERYDAPAGDAAPVDAAPPPPAAAGPSFSEAMKILWRRKSFVHLNAGKALVGVGSYGMFTWGPTYFIRTFHMSPGEAGIWSVLASGPVSLLAVLFGGLVIDGLLRRDQRWPLWLLMISYGAVIPLNLAMYLFADFTWALILTAITSILSAVYLAPSYALVQNLAGPRLRSTGAAIYVLFANLVGLGLGPPLVGLVSDWLEPTYGSDSLRYALAIVLVLNLWGVFHFALASRTLARDLEEAEPAETTVA